MTDCGELFTIFKEAEKVDKLGSQQEAIRIYSEFLKRATDCAKWTTDENTRQKLNDTIALAYNNRGYLKYRKVDFDDAIEDYTAGLNVKSDMYLSYYNRGLIHYRMGRYDKAITDMKSALQLKPGFNSAQSCLDQAQIDRQKKQKVEADLKNR